MNTLTWVLVGIVGYWMLLTWAERAGFLPSGVGTQGPITTFHTKRGRLLLERIARAKRFWRAWSNVGIGIALVLMAGSFVALLAVAISSVQNPQPTAVNEPRNVLVIPGVNDFLPLSMTVEIVIGLAVGLIVHEGGHGILCRVEDIDIDSMGLVSLAVVPIGAFVEPDEESQERADRGSKTRMFAAGVTNNFAITLVAFALLFGPVVGSIAVAPGAAVHGVLPGSPADQAGISGGDRITAVGGTPIDSNEALQDVLGNTSERTLSVELNGQRTTTVNRSVLVTAVSPRGPTALNKGATIETVNGTRVYTETGLQTAFGNGSAWTTVTTKNGTETSFPVGAYALVAPDGPFANASSLGGERVVVTAVNGSRVLDGEDLSTELATSTPNQTYELTVYTGANYSERRTVVVPLGNNPRNRDGYLGAYIQPGYSGVTVSDFGIRTYPAEAYLWVLGGDVDGPNSPLIDSFFGKVVITLFLPVAGVGGLGDLPFNFAGFEPEVLNFYVAADGPLAFLGGGVFFLANVLFWTGWINIQLGFFNCIPAFPLDGGRILRTGTEAVVSRLPVDSRHRLTRVVTTSVGLAMGVSLFLMIFGSMLLT